MKFSKLEKDVLNWLYEGEEDPIIRNQIVTAKPFKRKYSRWGVWVYVSLPDNLEAVPDLEGDILTIPGPSIIAPELKFGAASAIYITNGLFDTLEIFSFHDDFPEELENYELR